MDAEWTPVTRPGPASCAAYASNASYVARLAELEQMLQILARSRQVTATALETRPKRFEGDPVAMTQALHPDGLRSARRTGGRPSARVDAPMPVRMVVFDGAAAI